MRSSRASLTAYNCEGAMLLPTHEEHMQIQTGCSSSSTTPPRSSEPELDTPETSEAPSSREEAPGRGPRHSRRSPGNRELRGRTRMSLAGYNYIGAMSINAEDTSSTRENDDLTGSWTPSVSSLYQSEADSLNREPWNALRRWATDISEDGALDGDESDRDADVEVLTSPRSSLLPRSSARRSMRVAKRASLAGYNYEGAKSANQAQGLQEGDGDASASSNAGDIPHFTGAPESVSVREPGSERRDRLSTIGETLNMGISQLFGKSESSDMPIYDSAEESAQVFSLNGDDSVPLLDMFDPQAEADPGRRFSVENSYEALDGSAPADSGETWQEMFFGNEAEDDNAPMLGLQDDPIAEASFVFAVEYGRSYAYATTHHVRERGRNPDSDSDEYLV